MQVADRDQVSDRFHSPDALFRFEPGIPAPLISQSPPWRSTRCLVSSSVVIQAPIPVAVGIVAPIAAYLDEQEQMDAAVEQIF